MRVLRVRQSGTEAASKAKQKKNDEGEKKEEQAQ